MADALHIVSDFGFQEADRDMIRAAAGDGSKIEYVSDIAALRYALKQAHILCTFNPPADLVHIAPRLQWFQYPGAGEDSLQDRGLLRAKLPFAITTISSANAGATAEFVLGLMLSCVRHLHDMALLQQRREWAVGHAWDALRGMALEGQTLGIVGLGAIGRRVAQLARAFQMRVLGIRNRSQAGERDPDCDAVYGSDQLQKLLAESDIVLLSVPLTQQTTNLIGIRELQAMRPNAHLINIARGEVVNEPALIRALRERWIAGAALDVVAEEPLASTSPLWSLPGMLITPHLSGHTIGYAHRVALHFVDNLQRFRKQQPLRDVVDPDRGY